MAIVGYIDDSLLVGQSAEKCQSSIHETINLSESQGFVINYEKNQDRLHFLVMLLILRP